MALRARKTLAGVAADDHGEGPELARSTEALAALLGERRSSQRQPAARFWTEGQEVSFRGNRYRIVSRLGSSGFGATFKVVKIDRASGEDLGAHVGKVGFDPEAGRRAREAYELAHSHLRHPLSLIFEVASEWKENEFVALMSWIDGHPLAEYEEMLPLLAEDYREESGEALALRWLLAACEALSSLHDNGLVHGDISPRNMIVASSGELVLTDYDCVCRIGEPPVDSGTGRYCAPRRAPAQPEVHGAAPSDDFYALAASFFHVLLGREPFLHGGARMKERGLHWKDDEREQYPRLAPFLDRATHPDRASRLRTAAAAVAALRAARPGEAPSPEPAAGGEELPDGPEVSAPAGRSENEVPWLRSLLQSYPGSKWGNPETRGLDSDFAAATYVETDLEESLHRDIVERKVSLVVLCGNAGDGKPCCSILRSGSDSVAASPGSAS